MILVLLIYKYIHIFIATWLKKNIIFDEMKLKIFVFFTVKILQCMCKYMKRVKYMKCQVSIEQILRQIYIGNSSKKFRLIVTEL